jgi:preprotein translocase subunit SecG
MYQAVIIIHVVVALAIVVLVLLQKGRGAEAGAGFGGGGGSGSLFGARGSANFLSRTTSLLAVLFFSTSLILAYLGTRQDNQKDLMELVPAQDAGSADLPPVQPAPQSSQTQAAPENPTLPPPVVEQQAQPEPEAGTPEEPK